MKYGLPLIAVKDIQASRAFYEKVLSQKATLDLGANLTFGDSDSSFALQQDYADLVGGIDVKTSAFANDHELYFEEEDYEGFERHLAGFDEIRYVHKTKEYPWGQRVIRFYDPDGHIVEVGESMECVFKRFHSQGMTVEQVAERTSHPVEFVMRYLQ